MKESLGNTVPHKREVSLQSILLGQHPEWMWIDKRQSLGAGIVRDFDINSPDHKSPLEQHVSEFFLEPDDVIQITKNTPGKLDFQVDREGGITKFFTAQTSQLKGLVLETKPIPE